MNAIAPHAASRSITAPNALPSLPPLTPPVAHALAVALEPVIGRGLFGDEDPGHRVTPPVLRPAEHDEAQRAADAIDAMLAPITAVVLGHWLQPVNLASRNPQDPQAFAIRVHALAEMLGDLPAAALTVQARRFIDSQGFFPSAHDIREAIGPVAQDWTRKRDALRNLHRAKAEAPRRGSPEERAETPDERAVHAENNRLVVEALKAELAAKEHAARSRAATPLLVSPQQRIAFHRSKGQHAVADAIARANGIQEREEDAA